MKKSSLVLTSVCLAALIGCSKTPDPVIEYYYPAYRQLPSEPVYSRLTWNHQSQPYPGASHENVPKIQPVISFEMLNSTLEEAIQAVGRTIGYRTDYPANVAGRKVSIRMTGTAEEIVKAIAREAGVEVEFDYMARRIRILDGGTSPQLPAARNLPMS